MSQELERLKEMCIRLNTSNSTNDKINILKSFSDCKKLLSFTYDRIRYQYGITSDNVKTLKSKLSHMVENAVDYNDISDLLIALSSKVLTGHSAVAATLRFIYNNASYEELIFNIIDRNLKVRIAESVINKVFPGCISEFSVALAEKLDDHINKIDFDNNEYYVERKLDGVRTIALIDANGDVTFKSRNGKIYDTLGVIEDQIKSLGLKNYVIDGECCLLNSDGTDNFQGMMKEIRRKNHTIQNAAYRCFDIIPMDDFYRKKSNLIYSDRYQYLKNVVGQGLDNIGVIDAWKVNSWDDINNLQTIASDSNWEGLMLRKNSVYEGKRTSDLLKIKKFSEREFVVRDLEIGPFRVIQHDANGRTYEQTENVVTTLNVVYENNPVGIGSGLSIDMRRLWANDPKLILGKTITVKYFEETVDKHGNKSLRFPTLKTVHGIERND